MALDVSLPNTNPPPALKLGIAQLGAGSFSIEVSAEDGSAIDATHADGISVFSRSDLSPLGAWTRVTNSTVLANGKMTLQVEAFGPQVYFRTESPE